MWNTASTEALKLSVRVSASATIAMIAIGTPLALWMARKRSAVASVLETVLCLPLVLPPVVTGYLLLVVFGPKGLLGQWLEYLGVRIALDWKGAVVAATAVAFPLFLAVAKVTFEKFDDGLEDAARMLNAGPLRVFGTVTLPLALPGLLAAAAIAFARAFGEFGATMMLAGNIPGQTQTVPQAIFSRFQAGREEPAWALTVVSVSVGVAAMFLSQWLTRSHHRRAPRGQASA